MSVFFLGELPVIIVLVSCAFIGVGWMFFDSWPWFHGFLKVAGGVVGCRVLYKWPRGWKLLTV